jgi:predicted secreted hydrolase
MRSKILLLAVTAYKLALPGYHYEFPRDHFNHPEFQTEWWYYTGNLHASDGHKFGFELTFFRQGVDRSIRSSNVWDVEDVWLAHLALSDIDGQRFFHEERMNRSGPGLAGADEKQAVVWNGNWKSQWTDPATQRLQAVVSKFFFDLTAHSTKPPVIHGENGVSQKAPGPGRASHYISLTHLVTRGTITVEGKQFTVDGLSWMDHEFFTHQLEKEQTGWDWFSLQFDDGSDLMLFRLRHRDGSADPFSSGTYVDREGRTIHLSNKDFSLIPGKTWKSPATGGQYPIEWTISVPKQGIQVHLTTRLPQQELTGKSKAATTYWEGAIEVNGTRRGAGYLEMTGYAGPVRMGD